MKTKWILKGFKFLAIIIIGMIFFGFVVMFLWNALIPELFKGPYLTFWQAIGLLLLSHILLRGWAPWRHAGGWRNDKWRHRFEEKLAAMTPEEREKFKQEWRDRCGWGHTPMDEHNC